MTGDVVIEKTLVVGHLARRLPKPTEHKTHHWEIFLYSPTGEDLPKWVERVQFRLHPDFQPPVRVLKQEPYKVQDDGWGEFEAHVEVFPKSAISFNLICPITFPVANSKKPAVIERRQEIIVFRNPPPDLYEGLTAAAFTWNKFKRIKRQPKAADADVVDEPPADAHLEERWLRAVADASKNIRIEVQRLAEQHKAKLQRVQMLIEEIRRLSPDVSEAAALFF
jgi:YEATS domain-containing protein 4